MSTARSGAKKPPSVRELERSTLFSEELGIDLARGRDDDRFLWFLASVLYGARISGTIARKTYRAFVAHGLTTPVRILDAGRPYLIDPVMREGGYVRYDGRKSDQILRDCRALLDDYGGRMSGIAMAAADSADLERRLRAFYGVGNVTVNIFLREMRPFWDKADPAPLPAVREGASRLGIDLDAYDRNSRVFTRLEAGLIRYRHALAQA